MKGKHLLLTALFIGILASSLSLVPLANAQTNQGARFENITFNQGGKVIELVENGTAVENIAKVYDGLPILITLLFRNENLGFVNLYTKIYIGDSENTHGPFSLDNGLYADSWPMTLYGPLTQHWRVELWLENNQLLDSKEFDVWVVKLSITNWSPAPLTVEKGKVAQSSWSINFQNGGNDVMRNVLMSVVDNAGLEITPQYQNWDNIIAGENKSASFLVRAPFNLPTGMDNVRFRITYVNFMGISQPPETMLAPVIVDRLSTGITLSLDPSSVKIDNSTTITATLVDGNGSPMADQEISFSIGTTAIGSENTDSSGKATQIFVANVDAGTYAINASFAGTADYKPSSQITNLTVEPFSTTLVLDIVPSSVMLGDTVALKATLKDEKGNPLPNENVEFQIDDKTIGSVVTDINGVASIQYKTSTSGTLNVKAVFAGETNYENSSTIAKLAVNTSSALQVGIVALVVILVIVGLVFFAMRRGTKMPSMWRKEGTTLPENP